MTRADRPALDLPALDLPALDLPALEPAFGPWVPMAAADFADQVAARAGDPVDRPRMIAVDGRSASGKSTLSARLAAALPAAVVVHTDDIAWHHSFFAWAPLLIEGVLDPATRGEAVSFRPPSWQERGRAGSVDVPSGTRTVIVEGVGAAQHVLMPFVDAVVWMQSGMHSSRLRGIARDGGDASATEFWQQWMAAELPFQSEQRPWERAAFVVNGSSERHVPGRLLVSQHRG